MDNWKIPVYWYIGRLERRSTVGFIAEFRLSQTKPSNVRWHLTRRNFSDRIVNSLTWPMAETLAGIRLGDRIANG
jgi:hypothetical protein